MDPWECRPRCVRFIRRIRHEEEAFVFAKDKTKLADKQRTALNKQPITDVKPIDMVYVDLRKFVEAWAHQCELPGVLDSVHVLAARTHDGRAAIS